MKHIARYNIKALLSKMSDKQHFHMEGGRTFRNQFLNLPEGFTYGPVVSKDELLIICHSGSFTVEMAGDEKLLIQALDENGITRTEKQTRLVENEQMVVSAECRLNISCHQAGTVQLVGTPTLLSESTGKDSSKR